MEALHLMRPWWLLALTPVAVAVWLGLRARSSSASWRRTIAPELLLHLLDTQQESQQRHAWWLVLFGWLLGCIALAGPTWEKLPQPVLQNREALVIVLDLSLSMTAADIQPSRLQRARYKILDILKRRRDGLTGLVAYAGDAHVVTPLTDDVATIENLVPALAPDMMPVYGSDVGSGMTQAVQLLKSGGVQHGRILLITDGIEARDLAAVSQQLRGSGHEFSVLGVGTEQGAPIPISGPVGDGANQGGFLKQRDGSIVIPALHGELLQQLANENGGGYRGISIDDSDIDTLLPQSLPNDAQLRSTEREFDQWRERGPWLVVLLLPLAALAFRRGWLLMIFAALLVLPDSHTYAADQVDDQVAADQTSATGDWKTRGQQLWRNLWSTPDQQAARDLAHGDAKSAAQKFSDPAWRASAQYRAGDYENAAKDFQTLHDGDGKIPADADYNRGVALARAGQLEQALGAFDDALKKNPDMADAKANRDLVEKLLKQRQNTEPDQKPGKQNSQNNADSHGQQQQSAQPEDSQQQKNAQQQAGGERQQSQQPQSSDKSDRKQPSNSNQAQINEKNSADQKSERASNTDEQSKQQAQAATDQKKSQNLSATDKQKSDDKTPGEKKSVAEKSTTGKPQELSPEQLRQQQITEQWLRQIPDDPSGLLRRKFDFEHRQQQRDHEPDRDAPIW